MSGIPLITIHGTPGYPDTVEIDGVTYDRIARLPRNVRPGDLLCIGDDTDVYRYHRAFVIVTDVVSYPQEIRGWRRYPPTCEIRFRLRPGDNVWRWRSWNGHVKMYDQDTKEPIDWIYRARK